MSVKAVVAATDGSGESQRAVEWAAREAALRSVPLRIVSAASLPKMVVLPLQAERDAVLGYVREQRDRALAAAAARAAQLAPGLLIDTDPVEGQAARAVTESGSGALMLVIGFRGIGAFAAMALGSVARYAADHGSCPVVMVQPRQRSRCQTGSIQPGGFMRRSASDLPGRPACGSSSSAARSFRC